MRHSNTLKNSAAFLAAISFGGACASTGCSADNRTLVAGNLGDMRLSLDVAPSVSLDTVSYSITGPNAFTKSGAVDVSHSTKLSATISPLPAGAGYHITLNATARGDAATCSGSAPFDVGARQTTGVTVNLDCKEPPKTGGILVNGEINLCPVAEGIDAMPTIAQVGDTVELTAFGRDDDAGPSALNYAWSAPGGTLSSTSGRTTHLTCSAPVAVRVSLMLSDGDPSPNCASTTSIIVDCGTENADAGTGSGSGGATSGAGGATGAGGASGAAGAATGGNVNGNGGNVGVGGSSAGAGGVSAGGADNGGSGGVSAGGASSGGTAGSGGASTGGAGGGGPTADLAVYRVGDGVGSLVNTGNPVFIDEYSFAGSLIRTIPLPTTSGSGAHRLISSGTATSEGLISRSGDGRYVILTGYDAPLGTSGLAGTAAMAVPRTIGRLDSDGNVDLTTALVDGATGNNPRSATSTNGIDLWLSGGAGGVRYTTLGSSTSVQLNTTVTNARQLAVSFSQLFVSSGSGATRVATVGTGAPTTSPQTITNLPGISTTNSTSPYAFFFADLDAATPGPDVVYVTDDSLGLQKFSLVGGTWTASGVVGSASDTYRGLTGVVSGNTVALYAVRKGGSSANGGGELVSLTDPSGYNATLAATPASLVTASAKTAFRGIALAPTP